MDLMDAVYLTYQICTWVLHEERVWDARILKQLDEPYWVPWADRRPREMLAHAGMPHCCIKISNIFHVKAASLEEGTTVRR